MMPTAPTLTVAPCPAWCEEAGLPRHEHSFDDLCGEPVAVHHFSALRRFGDPERFGFPSVEEVVWVQRDDDIDGKPGPVRVRLDLPSPTLTPAQAGALADALRAASVVAEDR